MEYLEAYTGVLLAGVYRSSNETTDGMWEASTGRHIFQAKMSLRPFE